MYKQPQTYKPSCLTLALTCPQNGSPGLRVQVQES
uniref:Uncharacterized protein n=1 Tax=Anguilla anguilla TaxID=7936 RepID=A0A0E9VQC5_ANGAN